MVNVLRWYYTYCYVHYDVCTFIDVLYCVYFTDKSPSSVSSFELALVVYTAEYYEIPQGQPINVSVLL